MKSKRKNPEKHEEEIVFKFLTSNEIFELQKLRGLRFGLIANKLDLRRKITICIDNLEFDFPSIQGKEKSFYYSLGEIEGLVEYLKNKSFYKSLNKQKLLKQIDEEINDLLNLAWERFRIEKKSFNDPYR